jgi:hypothetical protein
MPSKDIKFTVGIDETSAAKTKRIIAEITQEVNRLVQATHQVNLGFGGGGGGGGFGAKVGAFSGGKGSGPGQIGTRMAQAGGGLTDNLARAVQNSAALFKGAASGSKDAFKVMSDSLKRHVDDSSREIGRLESSLAKLERQYDRLKTRQASGLGGKLTSNAMEQAQGEYYSTLGQLDRARSGRDKFIKAQESIEAEGDSRGHNGPFARARGYFRELGGEIKQVGGGIAQQMGLPSGVLNGKIGVLGVLGAIAAGAAAVAATGRENKMANIQYGIDEPFFQMNARATAGSIYGGNALAIHHGDLARVIAMARLAQSPDMQTLASPEYGQLLTMRRALTNPDSLIDNMKSDGIEGGLSFLGSKAGSLVARLFGGDNKLIGTTDVKSLALMRAKQQEQALGIENYQKALDAKMAEDPMFNDRANRLYQGAIGEMGLSRAAHISGGLQMVKVGNGRIPIDSVRMLQAKALTAGYSDSEYVGSMQELSGAAGMGFFGYGPSILGAKAGGLHNAASIFGAGAQFGGGGADAARRFLGRGFGKAPGFGIQGMIGRGGLDITAGVQVANLGMGLMNSGQFMGSGAPGSGLGIMQTLMEASSTGTTGGDMRMANVVQAGVGALGNMMSGGIDPLQKAMNASAALQAAPGGSVMLKDALMRMDPAQMMEFMRTKQVPPELASVGVTPQIMEKYIAAQNRTAFARVTSSMTGGGSSATGAAMERYRKAGGLGYLKGSSRKAVEAELQALAPGAVFAGLAKDNTGGLGYMRALAASAGLLGPLRGRGAGDSVSRTSARGAATGAQAIEAVQEGVALGEDDKILKTGANLLPHMRKQLEDKREGAMRALSSGNPEFAIRTLEQDLTAFVTSLKAMVQGSYLGTRPGPKDTSVKVGGK